jgi:hypothetical protein
MVSTMLHHGRTVLDQVLDLLSESDLVSLGIALIVFWNVGAKAVAGSQGVRRAGLRVGVAGFIGFFAWTWNRDGIVTGPDLVEAALRSLIAGGFATSAGWLAAATAVFLYEHTLSPASGIFHRKRQRY